MEATNGCCGEKNNYYRFIQIMTEKADGLPFIILVNNYIMIAEHPLRCCNCLLIVKGDCVEQNKMLQRWN